MEFYIKSFISKKSGKRVIALFASYHNSRPVLVSFDRKVISLLLSDVFIKALLVEDGVVYLTKGVDLGDDT